jgi:hypothetical protein
MQNFKLFHLFWVMFILNVGEVFAQNIDQRIIDNLNQLNFKYQTKTPDGTFQFTVPLGNRTQMLFIHSNTSTYDKLEIREIYSVIYQSPNKPNMDNLTTLLLDNAQKKLGAWELVYENKNYFIVFTAKILATADSADLKSAIDIVASSADAMEQQLFVSDEW